MQGVSVAPMNRIGEAGGGFLDAGPFIHGAIRGLSNVFPVTVPVLPLWKQFANGPYANPTLSKGE